MAQANGGTGRERGSTPAYASYTSFKRCLSDFKAHGVPNGIDRSALPQFNGSTYNHLMSTLRFLTLIDDADRPTDWLHKFKDAINTEAWPDVLRPIIEDSYPTVIALGLEHATPAQFHEAFRTMASPTVVRKCEAFFLQAAAEAGIKVSARIAKDGKARPTALRSTGARKRPASAGAVELDDGRDRSPDLFEGPRPGDRSAPSPAAPAPERKSPLRVLAEDILDTGMSTEEQQAVFTLMLYLKRREQGAREAGADEDS